MTREDGSLYGLDITIARNLAAALNVSLEFNREVDHYNKFAEFLGQGKFDLVISKYSKTYKRATKILFSVSYFEFRQGLLIRKKFLAQSKIQDFPYVYLRTNNFTVGIRQKTSYVEYAQAIFNNADIIEDTWDNLVLAIVEDKVDALFRDEYTLVKLVKNNPSLALYTNLYAINDKKDSLAIAVSHNSPNLRVFVNMFLESNNILYGVKDLITRYPEVF